MNTWALRIQGICYVLVILVCQNLDAQSISLYDPQIQGDHLDLITIPEKGLHILASDGIYKVTTDQAVKIKNFPTSLASAFRSQNINDNPHFIKSPQGYVWRLNTSYDLENLDIDFRNCAIGSLDKKIYAVQKDIRVFDGNEWTIIDLPESSSQYLDISFSNNSLWIAHYKHGVFQLDQDEILTQFLSEDGLFQSTSTSIDTHNDSIIVGHNGGLSIFANEDWTTLDLSKWIVKAPILDIECNNKEEIFLMSPKRLLKLTNGSIHPISLTLQKSEELIAIVIDDFEVLWILSNKRLFSLKQKATEYFHDKSSDLTNKLYRIRNNTYFSNGIQVFKYNPISSKWLLNPNKKAPNEVSVDQEGHTSLIFNPEYIMKVNDQTGKIIYRVRLPKNERVLNDVVLDKDHYLCTDKALFKFENRQLKRLQCSTDSFYNVIKHHDQYYALAKRGIYAIEGDSLNPLLGFYNNTIFPLTKNQFELENEIISFTPNAILKINLSEGNSQSIEFPHLNILDICKVQDRLFVLTERSLLSLELKDLTIDPTLNFIDHFEKTLEEGQLYKLEDDLWIGTQGGLYRVKDPNTSTIPYPRLSFSEAFDSQENRLLPNANASINVHMEHLPLKLAYVSNDNLNTNQQFTFHIGGPTGNQTQWQNESSFLFEPNQAGQYVVRVKRNDDVFGRSIISESLTINVIQPSRGKLLIIVPLVVFMIYLLGRVLRKISFN